MGKSSKSAGKLSEINRNIFALCMKLDDSALMATYIMIQEEMRRRARFYFEE